MLWVDEDDRELLLVLLPPPPPPPSGMHHYTRLLLAFLGRQNTVAESKRFAAVNQILILPLKSWVIVLLNSMASVSPSINGANGRTRYRMAVKS